MSEEYTCTACGETFIMGRDDNEAKAEHEERKKSLPDYDDGLPPQIVCDDCFKAIMRSRGHAY